MKASSLSLCHIGHVLYGSPTGKGGYEILAHSLDVSAAEQESVARFSNVGGSVLLDEAPEDVYAFYNLNPASDRWAFTWIFFLERGPRGNDYRALTLVIDKTTMEALRWDPFLLEVELRAAYNDFQTGALSGRTINRGAIEAISRRPLRLQPGIDPDQLAALLQRLSVGAFAVSTQARGEGLLICRSVMAALPPEDRQGLSFCTRFTYRRSLPFWLAAYSLTDEEHVGRYLEHAGSSSRGNWGSLATHRDSFRSWCEFLARGLDPLCGISLLKNPQDAVRLSHFFLRWTESGSEPHGMSQEVREQILSLTLVDGNQTLEAVLRLRLHSTWRALRNRIEAMLAKDSLFSTDFPKVSSWILDLTAKDPSLPVLREFLLERSTMAEADFLDRTACAILLLVEPAARPEALLGGPNSRSVFRDFASAAIWVEELSRTNPQAGLHLLTLWLQRWQTSNEINWLPIVESLAHATSTQARGNLASQGAALLLAAFEQAAPKEEEARVEWLSDLLRRVGPAVGPAFNPFRAARIAAQEGLIATLTQPELAELAEPLANRFPTSLVHQLDWKETPAASGLLALLTVCEEQSSYADDGAGWDMITSPEHWELVSLVALRSAQFASTADDSRLWNPLAWLLWRAARIDNTSGASLADEITRRFTDALRLSFQSCPPGVMHILADAIFHASRSIEHLNQEFQFENPGTAWLQTLRDIRDYCPEGARFYSLTVLSHLEKKGFFRR